MRFSGASLVRNDLLQLIADNTDTVETKLQTLIDRSVNPYNASQANIINMSTGVIRTPHSSTTLVSYTVPANRKAHLTSLNLKIKRETAASVIAFGNIFFKYTPAGGSISTKHRLILSSNVLGEKEECNVRYNLMLEVGDKIELDSSDSSTGGTILYQVFTGIVEYNSTTFGSALSMSHYTDAS